MLVTAFTRRVLKSRRQERKLLDKGFERVGDNGGKLWELNRGVRIGYRIKEVVIAEDEISLFVRIENVR